jgi:hypothetical protein
MLTHHQRQAALTHILENVLPQIQDDKPLYLALTEGGYKDIHHLVTMSFKDINSLTYTDTTNNEDVRIPLHARALLHILKAYHVH